MALNHQNVLDSPPNVAMREGNYASAACSSSTNQETVHQLTLSPKIPLQSKNSWQYSNGPTNLNEELDALLGPIEFDFGGDIECQISHSGEPTAKRRKIISQEEEKDKFSEEILRALLFPDDIPSSAKVQKLLSPQNALTCLEDDEDVSFHLLNHNIMPLTEVSNHSLEQLDEDVNCLDTYSAGRINTSEDFTGPSPCIISLESSPERSGTHLSVVDISSDGQELIHDENFAPDIQNNRCSTTKGLRESSSRVKKSRTIESQKSRNSNSLPHRNNERAVSLEMSWDAEQKKLYQEFMSSFPVLCLLELAEPCRFSIQALIIELISYGDFPISAAPRYQIPQPYRQVLDELTKQWSEGTAKNEFRKALIAYIKEKLELRILQEKAARLSPDTDHSQNSSELSDLLIREERDASDLISEWMDEVRVMSGGSKKLLRDTFARGREYVAQLREDQSRLRSENAHLRAELVKISDQVCSDLEMNSKRCTSMEANYDLHHEKLLSPSQG